MKRVALFVAACVSLCAESLPVDLLERKLMERIRSLDDSVAGAIGIAAIDLQTGKMIQYNAETVFPQASSIKIPILMEVFRAARAGSVDLHAPVTLQPSDAVRGSGHLQILLRSRPVTLSVRELATAMIETSDNTATNKLIAMVGMDAVNANLQKLGFEETKLQRRMLEPNAAAQDRENISTPREMARIAELLYRGKVVDAQASAEMIEILKLPNANFRKAIPSSVAVAAKPGELTGVHAETGIIFLPKRPFVLSVMSTYLDTGVNPVPELARMFYEHFRKLEGANRYGHNLQ